MDENESKNQPIENQEEQLITDAELAEIEASTIDFSNEITEQTAPAEVNFRHPQQILTNREIQILFEKKGKLDQENAERVKKGEEPIEGLTEIEKGAIQLFLVRAQHHGSKPKLNLSTKQKKARKRKRSISKASRKANR
jgi:hypothetical protein